MVSSLRLSPSGPSGDFFHKTRFAGCAGKKTTCYYSECFFSECELKLKLRIQSILMNEMKVEEQNLFRKVKKMSFFLPKAVLKLMYDV